MRAWVNRFVPFRSSFSNWSLPLTALATVRAASPVISPKDRLSSCQTGERIIDCGRGSSASQLSRWIGPNNCFPVRRAGASGRHLQDGEASRHAVSDGAGPGGPQQTVAEVNHLDAAQVLQGLKETRAVHLAVSTTSHRETSKSDSSRFAERTVCSCS